jgi:hypothetical protein
MVWANCKDGELEIPQNGLASWNTGKETQRKIMTGLGRRDADDFEGKGN